ncbi:uncharacterized protein PRCAT00000857001 [Priceomyces carsonii]|uniref:uncharacterized protein n=1 Tax=Priceomyces carsonii TaxID=28549 RepID=UPI002EDA5E76|nr:unnamed protein product [Priceomyces carsonii]
MATFSSFILGALNSVIRFPLNYAIFPIFNLFYGILNHFIIIPLLIVIRLAFYTFVYLPLKPALFLLSIDKNTSLIDVLPQLRFFFLNLTHYVMVGLIVGSLVGIFTGLNFRLISYIFTRNSDKASSKAPVTVKPLLESDVISQVIDDSRSGSSMTSPKTTSSSLSYGNDFINEFLSSTTNKSGDLQNYVYEDDDGYTSFLRDRDPRISNSEVKQEMRAPIANRNPIRIKDEADDNESISTMKDFDRSEDQEVLKNDLFSMNRINEQLYTMNSDLTIPDVESDVSKYS